MSKKHIFTDEDILNIINQSQKENKSCRIISENYNCSTKTIERLLKKQGVIFKSKDKVINNDFQKIIDLYLDGNTQPEISKLYNCSESKINRILKQNNISYKNAKHCNQISFTTKDKEYIIEQYENNVSISELAKFYSCHYNTVRKVILEYKKTPSPNIKQYKCKKLSSIQQNELIESYLKGISQIELCKKYNISRGTIRKILYFHNLSAKDNPNSTLGASQKVINNFSNISTKYNNGTSLAKLSKQYNISSSVISKIFKDNEIEIKDNYMLYTDEELLNILKYLYGIYGYVDTKLLDIHKELPTSTTYLNRFKTFGIAMEMANLPYNTIIKKLDNELCKSGYEYRLSLFFKKKNIEYQRDVLYKLFIPNYDGKRNCDYKIKYKDKFIYIEIFGMSEGGLRIRPNYKKNMIDKINMCDLNNIDIIYLYPSDFKYNNSDFENHIMLKLNNFLDEKDIKYGESIKS